jgi:hypothetical protein
MSTKYGLKLKETGDLLYVGQIRGSEPGKNYIGLGPEQYWNGDSVPWLVDKRAKASYVKEMGSNPDLQSNSVEVPFNTIKSEDVEVVEIDIAF